MEMGFLDAFTMVSLGVGETKESFLQEVTIDPSVSIHKVAKGDGK